MVLAGFEVITVFWFAVCGSESGPTCGIDGGCMFGGFHMASRDSTRAAES